MARQLFAILFRLSAKNKDIKDKNYLSKITMFKLECFLNLLYERIEDVQQAEIEFVDTLSTLAENDWTRYKDLMLVECNVCGTFFNMNKVIIRNFQELLFISISSLNYLSDFRIKL